MVRVVEADSLSRFVISSFPSNVPARAQTQRFAPILGPA